VSPRHVLPDGTVRIGTPIRDASVDPRPEDRDAPVNAGRPGPEGNPHGSHVVSTQASTLPHGRVPAVNGEQRPSRRDHG
jgi:hypothetical protein